ncbi:uncharacterized protein C4orf36 homolog isoform X1 [Tachyglossus aculeatus]|uniref:uncharacterized protein C4orf36 homolog isoform X1 n=1 Tax=Tachyglossus aculeatus TaxID=9261 RepID=UPI0018F559D2|nr:uncharacterized protein C4orf36 homolog isoform X1 [Tachyglossus aculeatus]
MAYGLPRKNTVKWILQKSCYTVQEPWKLAVLMRLLLENLQKIKVPLFDDIQHASLLQLRSVKTVRHGQLPSAQTLATEREYEQKRLKEIELRNKMANEIESLLKGKKGGLRKPLPPHHGQVLSEGLPLPPCPGETQTQDSPSLAHRPVQVTTGEGVISFST